MFHPRYLPKVCGQNQWITFSEISQKAISRLLQTWCHWRLLDSIKRCSLAELGSLDGVPILDQLHLYFDQISLIFLISYIHLYIDHLSSAWLNCHINYDSNDRGWEFPHSFQQFWAGCEIIEFTGWNLRGRIQVWPAHNRYVRPAPCTARWDEPRKESGKLFFGSKALAFWCTCLTGWFFITTCRLKTCHVILCFVFHMCWCHVLWEYGMGRYWILNPTRIFCSQWSNQSISQQIKAIKPIEIDINSIPPKPNLNQFPETNHTQPWNKKMWQTIITCSKNHTGTIWVSPGHRSLRRKAMAALAAREKRDLKELRLGERQGWLNGRMFFRCWNHDLRMMFIYMLHMIYIYIDYIVCIYIYIYIYSRLYKWLYTCSICTIYDEQHPVVETLNIYGIFLIDAETIGDI